MRGVVLSPVEDRYLMSSLTEQGREGIWGREEKRGKRGDGKGEEEREKRRESASISAWRGKGMSLIQCIKESITQIKFRKLQEYHICILEFALLIPALSNLVGLEVYSSVVEDMLSMNKTLGSIPTWQK